MTDMNADTINTRRFTKDFSSVRGKTLDVYDRGRWLGTWTPAPAKAQPVDFAERAKKDSRKMMPISFADLLKEGKKR